MIPFTKHSSVGLESRERRHPVRNASALCELVRHATVLWWSSKEEFIIGQYVIIMLDDINICRENYSI